MNAQITAVIADTFFFEVDSFTYTNTSYELTVSASGVVLSCNCADRKFRPNRPNGCKHMVALQAEINEQKAAEEAAAVAEVEAMMKEARFEAIKAEIEAINAKYAEKKAELVSEIVSTFEAEREEMVATFESKEAALARKITAIIKANEYRQELENSPWNSPLVATSNLKPAPALKAKEAAIKRAPQFANMEALKALPLNGNAGFSLLKVS